MFSKQSKFGSLLAASAMTAAATMVLSSAVSAQDVSKSFQVEVPVVDLLRGKPNIKAEIDARSPKAVKPASQQRPFVGKLKIQRPVESLLSESNLKAGGEVFDKQRIAPDEPSIGKRDIESPVQLLLDENGVDVDMSNEQLDISRLLDEISNSSNTSEAPAPNAKANNPSVEPGFVNWHSDLKTAASRSKISGKPVFHFQLLGQLDQRFT